MLPTKKQAASTICAFFGIYNVQRKVIGMNDLLNIDVLKGKFPSFSFNDVAQENIVMALEKEPGEDLLQGLYHRQLAKSTSMQNASALCHSDQVHRKDPKSYLKWTTMAGWKKQQFQSPQWKVKARDKDAGNGNQKTVA